MVSREELSRLVWSEPMSKIAEQFDVSGSYLARVCTLLNVPRPERGYWAKLAVGRARRRKYRYRRGVLAIHCTGTSRGAHRTYRAPETPSATTPQAREEGTDRP
jgi:hypothetical protein